MRGEMIEKLAGGVLSWLLAELDGTGADMLAADAAICTSRFHLF